MTSDIALGLTSQLIWTAILIAGPILLLSMLVGLLISVFQVVTQIQEMTLTFVPKLLVVGISLIVFGSWMLNKVLQFATTAIEQIPQYF